ncbi:MAG: peptidoglycan-binding domain-containing protein [Bacteroidota bacterium]
MKKIIQLSFLFSLLSVTVAFAQPSNVSGEAGKCYAKCLIPDEYSTTTEQIQTKAAYSRIDIAVPQMTTVRRSVMVKSPGSRIVERPAEYETVTERVLVKEESKRMVAVPATYETVTEQVEIQAASKRIIPIPGEYVTVSDNQIYMGTTDGVSTAKGTSPSSFDPNAAAAIGAALAKDGDPSGVGASGAGSGGAGNGASARATNARIAGSTAEGDLAMTGAIMPYYTSVASVELQRIPMEYETITERVEVSPASTKWVKRKADKNCLSANPDDCLVWCLVEVPAEYKTVTKTAPKGCAEGYTRSSRSTRADGREECVKVVQKAAQFGQRQIIKAAPSYREEVIPAQYATITKQKVVTPATMREEIIPAEYKTITKRVLKKPATYDRVAVPGEYKTTSYSARQGLILKPGYRWTTSGLVYNPAYDSAAPSYVGSAMPNGAGPGADGSGGAVGGMIAGDVPADANSADVYSNWGIAGCPAGYNYNADSGVCSRTVDVPAEYATVTKRAVSRKGGFSEWREVVCANKVTTSMVQQVQRALRDRGYDPGPIDNIIGTQTKAALVKFQKANGLPVGNLDMETLKALGVEQ